VVHAVADHQNLGTLPLQLIDARNLVGRRHARAPFKNSKRLRRVAYGGLAIAGQYLDFNPGLPEDGNCTGCIETQTLPHREGMPRLAVTEGDDGSFGIPPKDL